MLWICTLAINKFDSLDYRPNLNWAFAYLHKPL